ncbi:MAG: hypothetical protein NZL87_03810, partial [Thermomicrobium sp.]|nr:hypothetical protein [Thermomicrobium sp.]
LGLTDAAVVFIHLPSRVMGTASALLTAALLAAMAAEVGLRPDRLAGVLVRWTLFSLHTLLIVPLAIRHYVYSAVTGTRDWRKTAHEGAGTR